MRLQGPAHRKTLPRPARVSAAPGLSACSGVSHRACTWAGHGASAGRHPQLHGCLTRPQVGEGLPAVRGCQENEAPVEVSESSYGPGLAVLQGRQEGVMQSCVFNFRVALQNGYTI